MILAHKAFFIHKNSSQKVNKILGPFLPSLFEVKLRFGMILDDTCKMSLEQRNRDVYGGFTDHPSCILIKDFCAG